MTDSKYMQVAIDSAFEGIRAGEGGPFGASVVRNGEIIAVAHNTVLKCHDCTNHAETNAIRLAAAALKTYDLSDCDLYTTCEPCAMCWGAMNWARIHHVYIGVDRKTAAKFGFDDEFFYDEIALPSTSRTGVSQIPGVMHDSVKKMLQETRTCRRRLGSADGMLGAVYETVFNNEETLEKTSSNPFMQMAIDTAMAGAGKNKEREPFGAVIVKDGNVISKAYNTVLQDQDPTATAEMMAVREACKVLGTHVLQDCEMYTTVEPDVMSLTAIYWSRMKTIHIGVMQKMAAKCGFEEGWIQYEELNQKRSNRVVELIDNICSAECESVFVEWKGMGGELY